MYFIFRKIELFYSVLRLIVLLHVLLNACSMVTLMYSFFVVKNLITLILSQQKQLICVMLSLKKYDLPFIGVIELRSTKIKNIILILNSKRKYSFFSYNL